MDARIRYEACPLCDCREMTEAHVADCTGHPAYKPELPALQRWVRCTACDHVFVDGYFTSEALAILFSGALAHQTPGYDVEGARYTWSRIVENVEALTPGRRGRWLDVGFGNGSLLATAAEFGWDVVGLDARAECVRLMREFGFEAHTTDLTQYRPGAPLDVVSMADVLEHIPYPRKALEHTREILRDGGLLFLSMPNSDSFPWKVFDRNDANPYWGELEHFHNFSQPRLYRLLEEHGFIPRRYGVSFRYRACMEVIAEKVPRATRAA